MYEVKTVGRLAAAAVVLALGAGPVLAAEASQPMTKMHTAAMSHPAKMHASMRPTSASLKTRTTNCTNEAHAKHLKGVRYTSFVHSCTAKS
jgi:hypothetical protein